MVKVMYSHFFIIGKLYNVVKIQKKAADLNSTTQKQKQVTQPVG